MGAPARAALRGVYRTGAWRAALRIFDEIEHPDRDRVRAKLRSLEPAVAGAGR